MEIVFEKEYLRELYYDGKPPISSIATSRKL